MAEKAAVSEFQKQWDKAIAWAQSQGIGADSYLPVYQLDLNRLSSYGYGMSAGERNRAILAAHDPNNVTPAPSDHPSPWNFWGNTVRDVGQIATGLIHAPVTLYDEAKNTIDYVGDAMAGHAPSLVKWEQDTLLSLIPGVADIGAYTAAGGGQKGIEALAENPLLSILDVMPAGASSKLLAGTEMGDAIAARAGMTVDKFRDAGAAKTVLGILSNHETSKVGVSIDRATGQAVVQKLTLGDMVKNTLAKGVGGWGVGPLVGDAMEAFNSAGQLAAENKNWVMQPFTAQVARLSEKEVSQLQAIVDASQEKGGSVFVQAMKDPTLSTGVKAALRELNERVLPYAVQQSVLRDDVSVVYSVDGRENFYAQGAAKDVMKARDTMRTAETEFVKRDAPTKRLVDDNARLGIIAQAYTSQLTGLVQKARVAIAADPSLAENIARTDAESPTRFRAERAPSKRAQADAVFSPDGGLIDPYLQLLGKGDLDQIQAATSALLGRLSSWGPGSINAEENPVLSAVAAQVRQIDKLTKIQRRQVDRIHDAIEGGVSAGKEAVARRKEINQNRIFTLVDKQQEERTNLSARYSRAKAERADATDRLVQARYLAAEQLRSIEDHKLVNANARAAENTVRNQNLLTAASEKTQIDMRAQDSIALLRAQAKERDHSAYVEYQRDLAKMDRDHKREVREIEAKMAKGSKKAGDYLGRMLDYQAAIRDFNGAVWDHPPDNYRTLQSALLNKHLSDAEDRQRFIGATERHLMEKGGYTQERINALRRNPTTMIQIMRAHFDEVFNDPTLDPELAQDAKDYMDEAEQSARENLATLVAQGINPPYIPATSSLSDRGDMGFESSIKPIIGKGIPSVDASKARAWDMTAQRHDIALSVDHNLFQHFRRDATIDLVEHYLSPMSIKATDLRNQLHRMFPTEDIDTKIQTVPDYLNQAAGQLGLIAFDPKAAYGLSFPSWASETRYLPETIVSALKKAHEGADKNVPLTGAFRFSILALSPRYTAHMVFGGGVMMAIRNPGALLQITKAYRAMKDGTLPSDIFGTPTEEGYATYAMKQFNQAGGRDAGKLAVEEWARVVHKVTDATLSPVHWLKAAGDLNYTFTRYVRDMQSAMVYLDASEKATRGRVRLTDPATGREMVMSQERAFSEGMKAIERVYGNLKRTPPISRGMLRMVMPFWSWNAHILRYVMTLPFDHPYRAMVLSQLSYEASAGVPKGLPERLQFLFFLGSPDPKGNVTAVDDRFLDPFRDTANLFSLSGWIQALNPALSIPLSMVDPSLAQYGTPELYPNMTFNQFYGIEQGSTSGNLLAAVSSIVPQAGAVADAFDAMTQTRSEWKRNPNEAAKQIFEALNIPMFQVQHVNVKQIAAQDEDARYEVAKTDATNAFNTGDFSSLAGYTSVPYPLNANYEVTPAQLQAIYEAANTQYPGVGVAALQAPPNPPGY